MAETISAGMAERLSAIRAGIEEAAGRSGRRSGDVTLVAVSKKHPASMVIEALAAGQQDFGENYVQEAVAKIEEVQALDAQAAKAARWHFIGRLQSNKAKFLPGRFAMLHSLDSSNLARSLHKRLSAEQAPRLDVLIQVNLVGEEQKGGVSVTDLPGLAEEVMSLESLRLAGLMFMPPFDVEPEARRPMFAKVRGLRDETAGRLGLELPFLSMGMSDDYAQAIIEGATHVRIGTSIFGPRQY